LWRTVRHVKRSPLGPGAPSASMTTSWLSSEGSLMSRARVPLRQALGQRAGPLTQASEA
jgi:hypothetical protein